MIKIKHSYYFSSSVRYTLVFISFLFFYFIVFVPFDNLSIRLLMILFILLFSTVFFTREGIIIDCSTKQYTHSIHIFGLQLGIPYSYEGIEKLFINRIQLTGRQKTIGHAGYVRSYHYVCYIKLLDGTKFLFDYDNDKDELVDRLHRYNELLKTNIYDQSITPYQPELIS